MHQEPSPALGGGNLSHLAAMGSPLALFLPLNHPQQLPKGAQRLWGQSIQPIKIKIIKINPTSSHGKATSGPSSRATCGHGSAAGIIKGHPLIDPQIPPIPSFSHSSKPGPHEHPPASPNFFFFSLFKTTKKADLFYLFFFFFFPPRVPNTNPSLPQRAGGSSLPFPFSCSSPPWETEPAKTSWKCCSQLKAALTKPLSQPLAADPSPWKGSQRFLDEAPSITVSTAITERAAEPEITGRDGKHPLLCLPHTARGRRGCSSAGDWDRASPEQPGMDAEPQLRFSE